MQQAYAQANEIVTAATEQAQQILDNATNDANDIRIGAMQYTDDLLANAESIIGHTLDSYTTKYDGLVNSLQECYDMVRNNRSELEIPDQSARGLEAEYGAAEAPEEEYEEDRHGAGVGGSESAGPSQGGRLDSRIPTACPLSDIYRKTRHRQTGHPCGGQFFCQIGGNPQPGPLDHAVGLGGTRRSPPEGSEAP